MKLLNFRLISFSLLSLSLSSTATFAQNPPSRFERADTFASRTGGKVFRAAVVPNWLPDGTFWYKLDLADGKREYVRVDPVKRTRKSIANPPTDNLRKSGIAPENAPRASRSGGEDTTLTLVNRTGDEVKFEWISTEGQRVGYGTLKPNEQREQHTYAGHYWIVLKLDGTPLVVFEAGRAATLGEITGRVLPVVPPKRAPLPSPPARPYRLTVHDFNVFQAKSGTNNEAQLTHDGTTQDAYNGEPVYSPDGKFAVLFKTTPAQIHNVTLVQSSPKDQLQPKLVTLDYLKPGDRITHPRPHLFEVETGREIPVNDALFPTPFELTDLQWDTDGSRFTFREMERGFQTCRLISVDAHTGETRAVIDERSPTFIDWTNKVYLHRISAAKNSPNTHEAIWMSERDGWNHLYLFDTLTGELKHHITQGKWVVRSVEKADDIKRQVLLRVSGLDPDQDPYYIHYVRVNYDGTGFTRLTQGDGTHTLEFSPDGKFYLDTYSRVDLPPVTELHLTETGEKILDLERGDASALLATGWRYPERFVAKGRDGTTDIYGVILRPTNFDPAKKYPVIEDIYAGPQGAFVPKAFSTQAGMMTLAELGFIVVQCDGMGTNFRSRAFHDVCWHNLADAGFPDRMKWISAAGKLHPEMDLSRVGIYGTSAGGQNSLGGLLLHGDFYKVGVSDCGCHDNRMDKLWWNEQWMGYPVGKHYEEQSNVTLAPRLTGKLLLMVGEMDSNVDPASTLQVVNALVNVGKDFEFYLAPGVGHGVLGTPYGRHRMYDFFLRNLW